MSNSDELLMYKDAKHGLNQPWRSDIRMSTMTLYNGQVSIKQLYNDYIAKATQ
jgi:hypothetical protein